MSKIIHLTKEQIAEAIRLYANGEPGGIGLQQIGKRIGASQKPVFRALVAAGINIRRKGKPRSYYLDESVFDDAECNPTAAYFVGLIMADGCICKSFTNCKAKVAPMHSIWRIETKGRFAMEIIRRLYGQGGVSLPRKQAVADRILTEFQPNGRPKSAPKQQRRRQ